MIDYDQDKSGISGSSKAGISGSRSEKDSDSVTQKVDVLLSRFLEIPTLEIPTIEIPTIEIPTIEIPSIEIPSTGLLSSEIPNFQNPIYVDHRFNHQTTRADASPFLISENHVYTLGDYHANNASIRSSNPFNAYQSNLYSQSRFQSQSHLQSPQQSRLHPNSQSDQPLFKYKHGLIIGRFQIIHHTHADLINYLAQHCEQVVIVLGSAQYDYKNPKPGEYHVKHSLTIEERVHLIEGCFPNINKRIIAVKDDPSDRDWLFNLISLANPFDALLTTKAEEKKQFQGLCEILEWPFYSGLRNGIVIGKIIRNESYEHLVPDFCKQFIESNHIRERLLVLNKEDVRLFCQHESPKEVSQHTEVEKWLTTESETQNQHIAEQQESK